VVERLNESMKSVMMLW